MLPATRHHEHPAFPMLQHLQRQMSRTTETEKTDGGAWPNFGALDCAIANDARTQERRNLLVPDCFGQRIGKGFVHYGPLSVTSVVIPSSEPGQRAEVFAAAQ